MVHVMNIDCGVVPASKVAVPANFNLVLDVFGRHMAFTRRLCISRQGTVLIVRCVLLAGGAWLNSHLSLQ